MERCPVCGGYTAVRDFLHSVGVTEAREDAHRKRVVMYHSAVDDERVCADCASVLAEPKST